MYKRALFLLSFLSLAPTGASAHQPYQYPGHPRPTSNITKNDAGIFCLPAGEMPGQSVTLDGSSILGLWQAPYLSGMALRSTWSVIQADSNDQFDWSYFDSGLALAQTYDKQISLSVAAGGFCPDWLLRAGAQSISVTVNLSFKSEPQHQQIVLPWDPIFLAQWSAFAHVMGARYDGNPRVAYVYVTGAGDYVESFLIQNQTDYQTFNAAGGLVKWTAGAERLIDIWVRSFPNTPCMFAIGNPVNIPNAQNGSEEALENAAGQAAVTEVIAYGVARYPGHFGVVSQGLNENSDSPSAYVGSDFYVNQLISQNDPSGFQMVGSSTQGTAGDLGDSLNAGLALGARFIEVYKVDCLNPDYTEVIGNANDALVGSPGN